MTTETDLLPLPAENYVDDEGLWETRYGPYSSEQMKDYARANVARAVAPLQAEIEALRAEVAEMREFRNNLANAIGNDQLRRFIEKHGEPVPLTLRMQEAEARAERLAEAVRRAHQWGGLGKGWDSGVALDLIAWIESGMEGELPPLPDYLAALAQEDRNG